MTASGTLEAGDIALSDAIEEILVLRREKHDFMETVYKDSACLS